MKNLSFFFKDCWSYLMTGSTDDGGEHCPGGIVSGESSFAHAGAIVHNQSSNFVVAHVDVFVCTSGTLVLKLCSRVGMGALASYE